SDSSASITGCLLREAEKHGVEIKLQADVKEIRKEEKFLIKMTGNNILQADVVCIAAGGFPKSSMFDWIKELGHSINEPVPSLFTFNLPKHPITQLMGISVPFVKSKIEASKLAEEGPILITHWGLSGPA